MSRRARVGLLLDVRVEAPLCGGGKGLRIVDIAKRYRLHLNHHHQLESLRPTVALQSVEAWDSPTCNVCWPSGADGVPSVEQQGS